MHFPPCTCLTVRLKAYAVAIHTHVTSAPQTSAPGPHTPRAPPPQAVVHAMLGQVKGDPEHLKKSQQYYQLVGASASECDTIPGRQCMASCFFLLKQFEDVLVFLSVGGGWACVLSRNTLLLPAQAVRGRAGVPVGGWGMGVCVKS